MTAALFPPGETPISGEVQFWRMDPGTWERALGTVRDLGIGTIATYLSWRRHEPVPGSFDLRGQHGAELDVHRFLRLCRKQGLRVIVKPGPWICAEEPNGGLPDWIVGDDSLIALDHRGEQVIGYNPPFLHPMPSYSSVRFRAFVERWVTGVWADLRELLGPDGPVVATQYDNEPSLGFRDSMYGFDWHPDALDSWQRFTGDGARPPVPRTGPPEEPTELETRWAAWHREYISEYLVWLRSVHAAAGAPELVGTVNLNTHPVRGWPQDGPAIAKALPGVVVGEDHYFVPPLDEDDIAGLALAAAQARAGGTPLVWAPEMQAGIWRSPGERVAYPDPTVDELVGWWGAALALGYQGFNLYMLVDRENWESAPLDRDGGVTELGAALRRFLATVRSVPDLTGFRPLPDLEIGWSDEARTAAYRVRGTQSAPLTEWDSPTARAAYGRAVALATDAVRGGRQFDLTPRPRTRDSGTAVEAPSGFLARLHAHPDGRLLLIVVRWSRRCVRGPVEVRLAPDSPVAAVETPDGRVLRPDSRRVITVDDSPDGLLLLPVRRKQ